jgi:hypothetical protein
VIDYSLFKKERCRIGTHPLLSQQTNIFLKAEATT